MPKTQDWFDRNIEPWIQHTALGLAVYAPVSLLSNDLALGLTFGANSMREIRDWEKGDGFGWRTLLIPDAAFLLAWAIVRWLVN